jgi:hypothetical protein
MRTEITVKYTKDGGIVAHLEYLIGEGQVVVLLSGGNWEYEDAEEAQIDEIWEVLLDAQDKGLLIDPAQIYVHREFEF